MTIKERIQAEIDNVGEEKLDELYRLIKDFTEAQVSPPPEGIMDKLMGVRIEGPRDFAANLDQYLSGEKSVGDDVH